MFKSSALSLSIICLLGSGAVEAAVNPAIPTLKQFTQTPNSNSTQTTPSPTVTPSSSSTSVPIPTSGVRFACQSVNGQYTVMYYPESQPNQAYAWAVPGQLGGGWTAERRCSEISRRLESYRPDGLQELRTGMENGYNIICATTQRDSTCRIVLTVPPGQDPVATRDRVFENLTVADSGQQTNGVATFNGNDVDRLLNQIGGVFNPRHHSTSAGINLRPFLDRADGGNGGHLQGGVSTQSHPARLNPDQFR